MGPCLCGDLACPSCGNPALLLLEEAESWTMEQLSQAKLTADEYKIVVSVGLEAVQHCREAAKQAVRAYQIVEHEAKMYLDDTANYLPPLCRAPYEA